MITKLLNWIPESAYVGIFGMIMLILLIVVLGGGV